jgi:hypothetical protein
MSTTEVDKSAPAATDALETTEQDRSSTGVREPDNVYRPGTLLEKIRAQQQIRFPNEDLWRHMDVLGVLSSVMKASPNRIVAPEEVRRRFLAADAELEAAQQARGLPGDDIRQYMTALEREGAAKHAKVRAAWELLPQDVRDRLEQEATDKRHAESERLERERIYRTAAVAARQTNPAQCDLVECLIAIEQRAPESIPSRLEKRDPYTTQSRISDAIENCLASMPVEGLTSRRRCACPSTSMCGGVALHREEDWSARRAARSLVYEISSHGIRVRCMNGCEPAPIAVGIATTVTGYETLLVNEFNAEQKARAAARRARMDQLVDPFVYSTAAEQLWIYQGFIPSQALSLWRAPTEHMKTWVMLHAAICAAAGLPFLGRRVARRCRVLVVCLESRAINLSRIEPLARGLGVTRDDLRGWLYTYPHDLKSDDPTSMARLAEYIREYGIDLVLIDNATKIRTSRSQSAENSADVMSAVLEPLATLAQDGEVNGDSLQDADGRYLSPAVVLLDHDRGSTAVPQHADYVLTFERHSRRHDAPITVKESVGCRLTHKDSTFRVRYRGRTPDPIRPEPVDNGDREDEPGAQEEHEANEVDTRRAKVRAILPAGFNAVAEKLGGSRRDLKPFMAAWVADGEIVYDEADRKWRLVGYRE